LIDQADHIIGNLDCHVSNSADPSRKVSQPVLVVFANALASSAASIARWQ
jgi:hypothetical protein